MATAEQLFATNSNIEEHIVVGADRYITVPARLKRIAVQFDHDVETVTFDCPRYWDDLDMSKMVIYINYKLPDGTLDAYPAKNIQVDGDIMHFDWTISRNLTQYKGTITFLVCIKKTGTDGVEVNHWNSELCTDMYVSEGMECQEQAQMEYSDLITQLLERMSVVENINVQAEEMQALHDETLEAASLAKDESNYIKNSYANAYKQSASGEVIRVDDVSPLEHVLDMKVSGKNLVNLNEFVLGVTYLGAGVGQDIHIQTGADHKNKAVSMHIDIKPNTKYTFSLDNTIYWLDRISEMDKFGLCTCLHPFYTNNYAGGDVNTFTWTTHSKTSYIAIRLINKNGDTVTIEDLQGINLQIEEGETVTEYVCFDPLSIMLTRCGKNLIPLTTFTYTPSSSTSTFINGVLTVNGYIAANRVPATGLIGKKLTLSCISTRTGEKGGGLAIEFRDSANTRISGVYHQNELSPSFSFTVPENTATIVVFFYASGSAAETGTATYRNIQLEIGESVTDYEPYIAETYTPNSDGTIDAVCSLNPTLTLFTDTDGITIDLTYNRDNNKVIGDISTALDTLLAMQESTMTLLDNMSGGTS